MASIRSALVTCFALGTVGAAGEGAELESTACPRDTVEWRRGIDVEFCAAVCSSDADCERGIERCRILDPEAGPADPAIYVDDSPEIVDVFAAEGKAAEGLCDPFFDVEGVVGAAPMPAPSPELANTAYTGFSEEVGAPLVGVAPAPKPVTKARTTKSPAPKATVVVMESAEGEGEPP